MSEDTQVKKVIFLDRKWTNLILVYLFFAILMGFFHAHSINFGRHFQNGNRAMMHGLVIDQIAPIPWNYRVLTPYLVDFIREGVWQNFGGDPDDLRENIYTFLRCIFLFLSFVGFQKLLEHWMKPSWAFSGTLVFIALHGPSYIHYWYQPSSPLDLCLWIWAALFTLKRNDKWLFPIMFIGALNRETSVFIVLIHLALRWKNENENLTVGRSFGLVLIWATIFFGLRWTIPGENLAHTASWVQYFEDNIYKSNWQLYAMIFLGGWGVLAVSRWNLLPAELKRLNLAMLPYLGLIIAFGRIREVRLLLPLCVALLPAAILQIKDALDKESEKEMTSKNLPENTKQGMKARNKKVNQDATP